MPPLRCHGGPGLGLALRREITAETPRRRAKSRPHRCQDDSSEALAEVIQLGLKKEFWSIVEETIDAPVPQAPEVVMIILQERVQNHDADQIADVQAPQIMEESVEATHLTPQNRHKSLEFSRMRCKYRLKSESRASGWKSLVLLNSRRSQCVGPEKEGWLRQAGSAIKECG